MIKDGYYLAIPLRSVGTVVKGETQIVKVVESYCGGYCVLTFGEEFSREISEFHFIKPITTTHMKNQPEHERLGVYSKKDLENCKNLFYGLAIGGTGVLIGLVLELIK